MRREPDHGYDRNTAAQWAADLMSRQDWVIFDTETTGLTLTAEIVQIGVLSPRGDVLMDTLVRPMGRIEQAAQAIHGISDKAAARGEPFPAVYGRLVELFRDRQVITYNADFDRRMLFQCVGRYQRLEWVPMTSVCAMLQYARWYGDWNSYRSDYRWQRLPGGDHSVIGDCRATLRLIHEMAASYNPLWDGPKQTGMVLG